jgi:hypothetical protein
MGFKRLHENWALYQGTTLVVPLPIYKDVGFSHGIRSLAKQQWALESG